MPVIICLVKFDTPLGLLSSNPTGPERDMYVTEVLSLLSGMPDYFGRNKISSGGDLYHYSSASLY